ncbi:MAG: hypothetical protein ACXW2Y_08000 [Acidimicrobiia bacterium]
MAKMSPHHNQTFAVLRDRDRWTFVWAVTTLVSAAVDPPDIVVGEWRICFSTAASQPMHFIPHSQHENSPLRGGWRASPNS